MFCFRCGVVERVARGGGGRQAVCRGMFKKETDLSAFTGMQVTPLAGWPRRMNGQCKAAPGLYMHPVWTPGRGPWGQEPSRRLLLLAAPSHDVRMVCTCRW